MNEIAISIDIGGSHVACGIVEEDRVLASGTIPVEEASLSVVLPQIVETVRGLVSDSGCKLTAMRGMAVGICAIVDRGNAVLATNGKYDDGIGFDFGRWSKESFGLRGVAENDTRLALLGEHYAGAARGFEDAALITLGTGIGGAVLLGGRLLQSQGRRAGGLLGHLVIDWRGRMCSCGNRGCAEAEASTAALDTICRDREGFAESALAERTTRIDYRQLFQAADRGDRVACEVLDHCISVWSALAVSLIHAYDPCILVFGGGVMHRQEVILPRIREHVDRHAWVAKGAVKIVPSRLGASAALLGALPLLREQA